MLFDNAAYSIFPPLNKFNVFTVAIDYANVKGCRITPNIYNSIDEIEILVDAIRKLAS